MHAAMKTSVHSVYRRRRRRPGSYAMLAAAGAYLALMGCVSLVTSFVGGDSTSLVGTDSAYAGGRHLMSFVDSPNCTPRSVDQFPRDFLTWREKREGGFIIHICIALYMCLGIAIVCDDYFVSSLEVIAAVLNLRPDVAGATFMAVGSSTPELFTSLIGVFLAKSDVGLGTIVGSAVFNILINLAVCGLFAGMVIYLTWWPVVRDCTYYVITVLILVLIMYDEYVHWYESLAMVLMYILYIILMVFNQKISAYFMRKFERWRSADKPLLSNKDVADIENNLYQSFNMTDSAIHAKEDGIAKATSDEANGKVICDVTDEGDDNDQYESPLTFPTTPCRRIMWLLSLPLTLCFYCTIPDLRKPGCCGRLYMVTLVVSVLWIAGLAYVLVWMVTVAGDALGIPDTVMGLTLLAAGNSVPDTLSSYFVARDGYGDMAVSNSIGSNIFDILIGLGLPWLLKTGVVAPGSDVVIHGESITFTAITLLVTVLFILISFTVNGWKLDKKMSAGCLIVYFSIILFGCLASLNIFGKMNPPPCPRIT